MESIKMPLTGVLYVLSGESTVRNKLVLISFVMLLNIAAVSSAVIITWSNGGLDGNWNNIDNWTGNVVIGVPIDEKSLR